MPQTVHSQLEHLPISFFSAVMGLAGLSIAWEQVLIMMPAMAWLARVIGGAALLLFACLAVAYLTKAVRYRAQVKAEFNHPIKLSFFASVSVSLVLLSTVLWPVSQQASWVFWVLGTVAQFCVLIAVVNAWLHRTTFKPEQLNPSWFIPAVGNVLVSIPGVDHGFVNISWFFFSIGMLFWLVLMPIIFYRLVFQPPLPAKLLPTLFILIAPPAVGFLAYVKLNGQFDVLAKVLYYSALFFTFVLIAQAERFLKLPFALSSWAFSFPLAAITSATWTVYALTGEPLMKWLGLLLLATATLVISLLVVFTALAQSRKQICIPD
ncbi:MAG: SLAC1 anion channel family protein [Burkholderiaceae bacterium]